MNAAELLSAGEASPYNMESRNEESEEAYEEQMASRWRKAILRLSETFMDAAGERSDLSPILLEAMHNALNNLLIYGEAGDLLALEEWLSMEDGIKPRNSTIERTDMTRSSMSRGADRRDNDRRCVFQPVANDRRTDFNRRNAERRAERDRQLENIPASPMETPETVGG